jgi:3-oxoacyl-(acyl-carrier-protein) synthase
MLTRPLYEWYEAASVLSRACFEDSKIPTPFSRESDGLFLGEGMAAVVLEAGTFRDESQARAYAKILGGLSAGDPGVSATSWGENPASTVELIRRLVDNRQLAETCLVISSANGSQGLDRLEAEIIRTAFGAADLTAVFAPKMISGEFEASGISRLAFALARQGVIQDTTTIFTSRTSDVSSGAPPEHGLALLLGTSAGGGRAAILLDVLARVSA